MREAIERDYRRECKQINGYNHTDGSVFVSTVGGAVRFYGLELEADNGIDDADEQSPELLRELSPWIEFILKTDSSIDGIETVSVPLTLDYIRNHLRLQEWTRIMKKYNFVGDHSDCGMHIHISKQAFGGTDRKRNRAISAFLFLFHRPEFRNYIKIFSRRSGRFGYCSFYQTLDYDTTTITRAYPKALAENKRDRHMALNFYIYKDREYRVSPDTVEVRLFRGSLRKSTIVAAVELLDLFADIAISKWTEASLRALTWRDICNMVPDTSVSLKAYLKRHGIWEATNGGE